MITDLLKAGFPAILMQTLEPHRVEDELKKIKDWQIATWNCVSGLKVFGQQNATNDDMINPIEAINWLITQKDTVVLCHQLDEFATDTMVNQAILNAIPVYKSYGNCLVIISAKSKLPVNLQPYFHLMEVPLPDEEALYRLQTVWDNLITFGLIVKPQG